jgi:hypothetical protein
MIPLPDVRRTYHLPGRLIESRRTKQPNEPNFIRFNVIPESLMTCAGLAGSVAVRGGHYLCPRVQQFKNFRSLGYPR